MGDHPWKSVPLKDYEAHMSLPGVHQLQTLNAIMKDQLNRYPVETAAIAGVAGGNGLEHVVDSKLRTVYGLDLNQEYLDVCRERFHHLEKRLVMLQVDLSDERESLPEVELVIANLFIEYVGVGVFAEQAGKTSPRYLSCVIQKNLDTEFVSESPYADSFSGLACVHWNINAEELTDSLRRVGYERTLMEDYPLPNGKKLIRLDYRVG
ncbi:class I SAM-dependent methyltransferase [Gorillibacterium timonense]|uniref:class I SAM-dependent methyltransferase n=1 Tax=Gorillibacterium timonense TaxID=1689269 RepID=UPI00071C4FFF|nr:class I SAM-dependent methyltransferase [Gorillibacterium timonense]